MKKIFAIVCFGLLAIAGMALAPVDTDPVVMSVNGREVRLSEFEYLYHKNNSQQLQPLSVDEYLKLFVDYKLKVAEALSHGMDTTTAFRQELNQYRAQLILAYAADHNISIEESEKCSQKDSELSNLIKEYHDGILLFEISNSNVWEPGANNEEGQKAYFKANRKKYAWNEPHFKGYVMRARTDSVLQEAIKYADQVYQPSDSDQKFMGRMKAKFGNNLKINHVIAAKGDSPITDHLGWGTDMPDAEQNTWKSSSAYRYAIIDQPEELDDVKSLVISDYQNELERQWLKVLRKKHKVKINKKAISSCK